jgi:hypothetical protein
VAVDRRWVGGEAAMGGERVIGRGGRRSWRLKKATGRAFSLTRQAGRILEELIVQTLL